MKIIIIISLLICLPILIGFGCEKQEEQPTRPDFGPDVKEIPADSLIPATEYTIAELGEHATPDDCWVAVDNVVYDLTEFAPEHPAGSEEVTRWCGQDATEGFDTKNMTGGSHSIRSKLNLDNYFRGNLIK